MNHYSATYSPEDNKLRLYSISRLDSETYARVKAAGFRWAPKQDLFVAPMWTPGRADLLEELCGEEIGDEDTSLAQRAEQRSERFQDYSASRKRDAESAKQGVGRIADGIPMGQPILVGHHSEKHARKDAERIENGMRRAVKMWETSKYWTGRAAGAIHHAKYKEQPAVRHRRIKKLETDKRREEKRVREAQAVIAAWWERHPLTRKRAEAIVNYHHHWRDYEFPLPRPEGQPQGGKLSLWYAIQADEDGRSAATPEHVRKLSCEGREGTILYARRWLQHINNRLLYERAMLGEQIGVDSMGGKWDIQVGGRVLFGGEWRVVLKVNRAADGKVNSVRVPNHWSTTLDVSSIRDYREPEEGAAAAVKKATALPPLCNYPGEGFREMTKAEWKKRGFGKRVMPIEATAEHGRHRVRSMSGPNWERLTVYLTDQKRVDPPPPKEPTPAPELPREFADRPTPRPRPEPEPENPYDSMRETLREGVKVVSAPELFPTPVELARRMVDHAGFIPAGARILEPSAGTGRLLQAVHDRIEAGEVVAVEQSYELAQALRSDKDSEDVRCSDFLECLPEDPAEGSEHPVLGLFDVVLMNPPFSKGQDREHVQHAFKFLKPGGVLVAIMSPGPFFHDTKAARAFRDWFDDLGGEAEDLPADSFKASGTSVNARLVRIVAPCKVSTDPPSLSFEADEPPHPALRAEKHGASHTHRVTADQVTAEFATSSPRRIDGGKACIEDAPLFGGERQGELF